MMSAHRNNVVSIRQKKNVLQNIYHVSIAERTVQKKLSVKLPEKTAIRNITISIAQSVKVS
jgi:hypothetical protein